MYFCFLSSQINVSAESARKEHITQLVYTQDRKLLPAVIQNFGITLTAMPQRIRAFLAFTGDVVFFLRFGWCSSATQLPMPERRTSSSGQHPRWFRSDQIFRSRSAMTLLCASTMAISNSLHGNAKVFLHEYQRIALGLYVHAPKLPRSARSSTYS